MILSDDWIIGFFEGEGCFYEKKEQKGKYGYPCAIIVNTNKTLLEAIKSHLGIGRIYKHSKHHDEWNHCEAWQLCIVRFDDTEKLVKLFEGKLHSDEKIKQFETFKQLVAVRRNRLYYCRHCREYPSQNEVKMKGDLAFCDGCGRQLRKLHTRS